MATHQLKIRTDYFQAVRDGTKNFEVRRDDREPRFAVGDRLELYEYVGDRPTNAMVARGVKFILRDFPGVEPGYCVMALGH